MSKRLLPLNLQLFAENNEPPAEPPAEPDDKGKGEDMPAWAKKMQQQIDNLTKTGTNTGGAQQVPKPQTPPVTDKGDNPDNPASNPADNQQEDSKPSKSGWRKALDYLM